MKLILTDDDGSVLDSVDITAEDWRAANRTASGAWALLDELSVGAETESSR